MAQIGKMSSREPRNYLASCIDETKLQPTRLNTKKGESIIRFVPEVRDGEFLPMVLAMTQGGPDFSNFRIEPTTVNAGKNAKFTGFACSSDRNEDDSVSMVFPGLFIRLRGRQKAGELPPHLEAKVNKLLSGGMNAPLRSTPDMAWSQAIILKHNGKDLEKPAVKQAVPLTSTAAESVAEVLTKCYEDGIDVFSPDEGRAIVLTPVKQRIGDIVLFEASVGDKVPLPPDACKKLWVPWEDCMKRHTWDQMLKAAVSCFGADVVEYAFEDDYARVFGQTAAPAAVEESTAVDSEEVRQLQAENLARIRGKQPAAQEASADLQIDTELPSTPLDAGEEDEEVGDSLVDVGSDAGEAGAALSYDDASSKASKYEDLLGDL